MNIEEKQRENISEKVLNLQAKLGWNLKASMCLSDDIMLNGLIRARCTEAGGRYGFFFYQTKSFRLNALSGSTNWFTYQRVSSLNIFRHMTSPDVHFKGSEVDFGVTMP